MGDLIDDLHDIADEMSAEEYSEDAERIRDAIAEIERLRAAAVGASVGAGWQPIATAPQDREITVWRTEDGPCTVHWFDKSSRFTESGITGWHLHDGHQWHVLQGHMPTHWCVLQPPPSVGAHVGAEEDALSDVY